MTRFSPHSSRSGYDARTSSEVKGKPREATPRIASVNATIQSGLPSDTFSSACSRAEMEEKAENSGKDSEEMEFAEGYAVAKDFEEK